MELVKIINTDRKYKAKNGKEYVSCNYYLVINGNYVAIRPCFKKSYYALDVVATLIKNGK